MNKIFLKILKEFITLLTLQQLKVFQMYYVENKGYSNTGRALNISRQRVEMLCKAVKLKLEKLELSNLINRLNNIDSIFEDKGILLSVFDFKEELLRREIAIDRNEVVVLYRLFKDKELEFFEDRYILAKIRLTIDKCIMDCFNQKRILNLIEISYHLKIIGFIV